MKNSSILKVIVAVSAVVLSVGVAAPASADTTTSGYYDQFGTYHVYQTYTPSAYPTYYGNNYQGYNTYGNYNTYYGTGYNQQVYGSRMGLTCATGETYDAFNNVCFPNSRRTANAISGSGLSYSGIKTGSSSGSTSGSTSSSKSSGYQASAVSSLFGKKTSDKLEISNIVIESGPKNIYEDKSDVNCDVRVSWTTSVPSAGQVVYGTVSQPNIDSFSYPSAAPEGNSYQKSHQVKLGCLDNTTYSLRVIAYSQKERVVSDEQTIFPIKIQTQIPSVKGTEASSASATWTLGSVLTNPFVLIAIFALIAYFVISRLFRKGDAGHGASHAPAHAEPALQIPHH